MIVKNKHSTPKVVYRKKPWKIACMVIIPCLILGGIGGVTYYGIQETERNRIRYHIVLNSIPACHQYKNMETVNLTNDILKNIIAHSFSYYNKFEVDTSKTFNTKILDATSNASIGMVNVSTFLTLKNGRTINGEFQISGFKPQPRPQVLNNTIDATKTMLAEILPTELVDSSNPQKFDIASKGYKILKQFLFNALPDKPKELTIDEFNIEIQPFLSDNPSSSYSSWDGYMYVKYWLNKEQYKYPVFSNIVRVNGFKKYNLVTLTPNAAGEIIINAPATYSNSMASEVGDNNLEVRTIIANYLKSKQPDVIPLGPDDINVNITNIDNNNGQIVIRNLQVNKFNPPLTYTNVFLRGFKIERPILNNSKIQLSPSDNYSKLSASDVNYNDLQSIIYKNLIIPRGLKLSPTDLSLSKIETNNIDGVVKLHVTIPAYVVQPFDKDVTITSFAIKRPDPIVPTEQKVSSQYADYKPSLLTNDTLKRIVFQIIKNKPSDLQVNDIEITSKTPNDAEGKITVTGYIPKYQSRDPYNFTIDIVGFKK